MEILRKYHPKGVIHCFSGNLEMAKEVIDLGLLISFTGIITFKNFTSIDVPDYLIINKNHDFWSNGRVSKDIFNKYHENSDYIIYSKKLLSNNCS